jgi:predicted nucleic acid-binding protein
MEHHGRAASQEEGLSRIYWDAMVFIYLIEDHPLFAPKVQRIYERILERQDTLCTSTFSVGEALVGAIKGRDTDLAARMKAVFRGGEVTLLSFHPGTAELYADIRANFPVTAPDAIHLATAAEVKTDVFVTNDKQLHRLIIPGISFIAGLDGTIF